MPKNSAYLWLIRTILSAIHKLNERIKSQNIIGTLAIKNKKGVFELFSSLDFSVSSVRKRLLILILDPGEKLPV